MHRKSKRLSAQSIIAFRKEIYTYYQTQGRNLPWRRRVTPYRVLVSEIMLQQTQVERVIVKYSEFLAAFPDFASLAEAPLPRLLAVWSGMGYNRRALALRALAHKVMTEHSGRLPKEHDKLLALPGIGKYTAGAVMAFAFNQPVVFMDTNIRRVYLHEFFEDKEGVHDDQLLPIVEQTMDRDSPRNWFNALMDYGSMLKREQVNPNRRSAHYSRQSPFENSNRQVRGAILKLVVNVPGLTRAQITRKTGMDPESVAKNLLRLEKEGFIRKKGSAYLI